MVQVGSLKLIDSQKAKNKSNKKFLNEVFFEILNSPYFDKNARNFSRLPLHHIYGSSK